MTLKERMSKLVQRVKGLFNKNKALPEGRGNTPMENGWMPPTRNDFLESLKITKADIYKLTDEDRKKGKTKDSKIKETMLKELNIPDELLKNPATREKIMKNVNYFLKQYGQSIQKKHDEPTLPGEKPRILEAPNGRNTATFVNEFDTLQNANGEPDMDKIQRAVDLLREKGWSCMGDTLVIPNAYSEYGGPIAEEEYSVGPTNGDVRIKTKTAGSRVDATGMEHTQSTTKDAIYDKNGIEQSKVERREDNVVGDNNKTKSTLIVKRTEDGYADFKYKEEKNNSEPIGYTKRGINLARGDNHHTHEFTVQTDIGTLDYISTDTVERATELLADEEKNADKWIKDAIGKSKRKEGFEAREKAAKESQEGPDMSD